MAAWIDSLQIVGEVRRSAFAWTLRTLQSPGSVDYAVDVVVSRGTTAVGCTGVSDHVPREQQKINETKKNVPLD